ncbi:unnamed protein product [Cochlearia groenlandica]
MGIDTWRVAIASRGNGMDTWRVMIGWIEEGGETRGTMTIPLYELSSDDFVDYYAQRGDMSLLSCSETDFWVFYGF